MHLTAKKKAIGKFIVVLKDENDIEHELTLHYGRIDPLDALDFGPKSITFRDKQAKLEVAKFEVQKWKVEQYQAIAKLIESWGKPSDEELTQDQIDELRLRETDIEIEVAQRLASIQEKYRITKEDLIDFYRFAHDNTLNVEGLKQADGQPQAWSEVEDELKASFFRLFNSITITTYVDEMIEKSGLSVAQKKTSTNTLEPSS